MTHFQNIVGGQKRLDFQFEKKSDTCNVKWQYMMANYEIAEFIAAIIRLYRRFSQTKNLEENLGYSVVFLISKLKGFEF